jgi:hypothetical protein
MLKALARQIIPTEIRYLRSYRNLYLRKKGWQKSIQNRHAIDNQGPIPWITYPAKMMLERVVQPHHRVFEFGAGNSSLWWAEHVAEVVSVEHDKGWAAAIHSAAPKNLTVIAKPIGTAPEDTRALENFYPLQLKESALETRDAGTHHGLTNKGFEAYALALTKFPSGHFDIVVVDGMARVLTAWLAAQYVNASGFIVFDNSDRKQYNDAFRLLADAGFKRIDFYGTGPVNCFEWCTSIFAKEFGWLSPNSIIPDDQRSDIDPV